MFVIISRVIGVYSVFPVRAIDALWWCLRPLTSPCQPHQQSTYIMYISMVRITLVVEVCEVLKFGLCGCVSQVFLSICETTTRSKCATHFWWRPPLVHHVPRCRLRQLSKSCWVVLLGLGLGLELGLGSVLRYDELIDIWHEVNKKGTIVFLYKKSELMLMRRATASV